MPPAASAPEIAIRVRAAQRPALGEPLEGVPGDVDRRRRAIEDELREALADRRGGLEPGPGEAARQDEPVRSRATEDRALVGGRDPVLAAVGDAEGAIAHPRH